MTWYIVVEIFVISGVFNVLCLNLVWSRCWLQMLIWIWIDTLNKPSEFKILIPSNVCCMEYDWNIFSKYLVFQMKVLVFRSKTEVYNREIWHNLLTYNFQINKKAYLQTLKFLPIPSYISITPFMLKNNHIKNHIYESQNTWHSFFLLIPFSNIKKVYLQISKYLAQFFAYPLFQILKKHIYEFENTWHRFLLIPFFKY